MPRLTSITKEMVIEGSINYVRAYGIESLSARKLSTYIECSTQPIYSYYENITALKDDIYRHIYELLTTYMTKESDVNPFFQMGLGIVQFAKEEPELFRCLYFSNNPRKLALDHLYDRIRSDVYMTEHDDKKLLEVYRQISIYTHGLACIVMDQPDLYDDETIKQLIASAAQAFNQ